MQEVSSAIFDVCLDYVQGRMSDEDYKANRKIYEQAKFRILGVTPPMKTVPRSADVSTGQLNFGCDQGVNAETPVVPLGQNPQSVTPQARWVNMNNVKNYNATTAEVRDANNRLTGIKGVGPINGLDSQYILGAKNCPGGGHGELTLHVTWTEDQPVDQ
jgi:hypothetical protein